MSDKVLKELLIRLYLRNPELELYDRKKLDTKNPAANKNIRAAEGQIFMAIYGATIVQAKKDVRKRVLEEFGERSLDRFQIDWPLKALEELAHAYEEAGIVNGAKEAEEMARQFSKKCREVAAKDKGIELTR